MAIWPVAGQAPVLVLGGSGMLGRSWCRMLSERKVPVWTPARREIDLAIPSTVDRVFDQPVGLVVNCAAWTDVDGAEADESGAMQVNAHAVGHLARRCAEAQVLFVHYSTDYVFDGRATEPYAQEHPRSPINAYGRSKALSEELLEQAGGRYLLVRASWTYAPWGQNIVRTVFRLAAQHDVIRFVNDQRGRPTSAEHLAAASAKLLEMGATGTYHVTDGGACTWFEFAREIVHLRRETCRVEPCGSQDLVRPATRPEYSVLALDQTEALIGPMPSWQENLAGVLRQLEDDEV